MKKYLLFSTNNQYAVDNVSFCISYENEMQLSQLRDVCTYSFMTLSPIGKPEGGVITFEEALEKIKSLVLHREALKLFKSGTKIIELPDSDHIRVDFIDGQPIIDSMTRFSDECIILKYEHKFIQKLLEIFPNNLGYHQTRAKFAVHNWSKTVGNKYYRYQYTVCDNRIIELCDIYTKELEEL